MRVLVVDDHPVVAGAVAAYLEKNRFEVVDRVNSAEQVLEHARNRDFDVLVLDIVLGKENSLDLMQAMRASNPVPIVAFSGYDSFQNVSDFMKAGGTGFVSKSCSMGDLVTAIRAAADGRSHICPPELVKNRDESEASDLSPREREIATLIASGYSSKQMAHKLFVSVNTIQTHRLRIFRKLGIHTVAELTKYAIENGLLGAYNYN